MINVNELFKQVANRDSRTFRAKAIINDIEYKEFREVKITQSCESNTSLSFGSTSSACLNVTIVDVDKGVILTGQKIKLFIGLKTNDSLDMFDDDSAYTYIQVGEFNVDTPSWEDSDVKITAYDHFYLCEQGFFTNLSGMQKVKNIVSEQCTKLGIEFVDDIEDVSYNVDVLKGLTIREAFGYLASFLGKNAIFNNLGKLQFVWYTDSQLTIDSDRFSSPLTIGNAYAIGSLSCTVRTTTTNEDGVTQNEDTTYTSGSGEGISFSNLYMTQERLNTLLSRIQNFSIRSAQLNWNMALPQVTVGDIINIKDSDNTVYAIPVMEYTINIDGGCYGTVKSKYISQSEQSKEFKGSLSQQVERIYTDYGSFKEIITEKITAFNGEFVQIDADFVNVNQKLTALEGQIGDLDVTELSAKVATIEEAYISKAQVEQLYATKAEVGTISANVADIQQALIGVVYVDDLNALEAKINEIEAGSITTDYLETNYAKIDLSNIENGCITTAMIQTGAIGTAQIADGSITDAKIVGLTANKITAGTIDASDIEVINLNCANLTVGTINGQQIANNAIDWDKLSSQVSGSITEAGDNANQALEDALEAFQKAQEALNSANSAQTTANGKNTVFYQSAQPAVSGRKVNDIWYDTDDGYKMYYFNGTSWQAVEFGENAIADDAISADKIASDVNSKINDAFTNAGIAISDSSNALSKANTAINDASTAKSNASTALSTANSAKSTADSALDSINNLEIGGRNLLPGTRDFSGADVNTGDVISETYNGFPILYYDYTDGTSMTDILQWLNVIDVKPSTEYILSFYAKGTGQFRSFFYGSTTGNGSPIASSYNDEGSIGTSADELSYHSLTEDWKKHWVVWKTKPDASGLKNVIVARLVAGCEIYICGVKMEEGNKPTDWTPAPEDVDNAIELVQTTADGKNTVFYQTSAPSTSNRKVNDVWFDTDDSNKMYYWNGSAWTARQFGTNAIANLAITNALIANGTIQNAKIANLDAAKITSGYINVARLQAGSITADKLKADTITAASGVIADAAILTANIADLAVSSGKIANAAIGTAKIADLAVTNAKLADLSVTNAKIADATIQSAKIASLDAGKITSGYISSDRIQAGSLAIGKLDTSTQNAINNTEKQYRYTIDLTSSTYDEDTYYPVRLNAPVPNNTVYSKYQCNVMLDSGSKPSWSTHNGGFTCNLIAYVKYSGWGATDGSGWIEENYYGFCDKMPAYIQQLSYTSKVVFYLRGGGKYYIISPNETTFTIYTKKTNTNNSSYPQYVEPTKNPKNGFTIMEPNIIGSWCYSNDTTYINGGKIYTGTVTASQIAANAIVAGKIAANAVTTSTIAADAVNADKIAAKSINAEHINGAIITGDMIVASTITGAKIAAKTITANNIAADTITAAQIASGTITSTEINVGSVKAAILTANSITSTMIAANAITSDKISANAITSAKIATDAIKSRNYVANSAGSYLNLQDGSFTSKNLKWTSNGTLTATNGNFSGTVNATSGSFTGTITASNGKIGGFTIDSTSLRGNLENATGGTIALVGNATGSDVALAIGANSSSRKFSVTANGILTATSANITGTITGSTISGGTISGASITGGSITSNTSINVTTDLKVGKNIYLDQNTPNTIKTIQFNGNNYIQNINLSSNNSYIKMQSNYRAALMANGGASVVVTGNAYGKVGVELTNPGDTIVFEQSSNSTYSAFFRPNSNGRVTLGIASNRFFRLYQSQGSIDTSDERKKHNILPIKDNYVYEKLFNSLIPKTYCMNNDDIVENSKVHIGFIAQDIAKTLLSLNLNENETGLIDYACWTDENGNQKDEYGLCYSEFIALNTHMIQKTILRVDNHDKELQYLRNKNIQLRQELKNTQDKLDAFINGNYQIREVIA